MGFVQFNEVKIILLLAPNSPLVICYFSFS